MSDVDFGLSRIEVPAETIAPARLRAADLDLGVLESFIEGMAAACGLPPRFLVVHPLRWGGLLRIAGLEVVRNRSVPIDKAWISPDEPPGCEPPEAFLVRL